MRSSCEPATMTRPTTIGSRCPNRPTMRGVRLATIINVIANGTVRIPAASVPYPSSSCRCWVSRKMVPKRQKYTAVTATLAPAKRGLRNTLTSSIGDGVRVSCQTKSAITAMPAAIVRQRRRIGPAVAAAADDAVDEDREADDREQRARRGRGDGAPGRATRARTIARPTSAMRDHGQVHQEDRSPVEVLEQHAAGERPERDADARGARPHRDRLLALHRVGEHVGDQRERRREDRARRRRR